MSVTEYIGIPTGRLAELELAERRLVALEKARESGLLTLQVHMRGRAGDEEVVVLGKPQPASVISAADFLLRDSTTTQQDNENG